MSALKLDQILKQSAVLHEICNSRRLTYILAGKEIYQILLERLKVIEFGGGYASFRFIHSGIEYIKFGLTGDFDLILLDQDHQPLETVRIELTDKKA
ncbi:hypothetical protein [Vibrio sp. ER1A]|uniref:hypothetical protein n=1 Tax=Vibrio sp. ER1A TaxID=1517681 RepID=UPI0004DD19F2|nr:hypothetical protein [Vibrio sp. ER1A]KFA99452.1 hypothetical protein HW45_03565 [Vibrio sp. ER1A]